MRSLALQCTALFVLASALFAPQAKAAIDVYFLRHGETPWNRARILQGSIPHIDLTDNGVRMAEETAKGLSAAGIHFGRIYTSPYLRAKHTAEVISAGGVGPAPIADRRLREMCFGQYEGMHYEKGSYPDDNLRCFFENPEKYVPQGEGAESFDMVGRRIRDFLDNEIRPLDGQVDSVLCVAHSLVLKSLVREFAGKDIPASAKQTIQRNCCVHKLRYENGRFTLKETGRIYYSPEHFDVAAVQVGSAIDSLARFWQENDGKTVRRLPIDVLPENVFWWFTSRDFSDGMKTFNALADEGLEQSTYNGVTLSLRCNPELGDQEVKDAAKAFFAKAHLSGVKVYMDTDPRIARREFFSRWPDERQGIATVVTTMPTNGVAEFSHVFKDRQDHMTSGAASTYFPLSARVAASFAVRRGLDGSLDLSASRRVEVVHESSENKWRMQDAEQGGHTDRSFLTLSGKALGLADDEVLVAVLVADYNSIDVFSPHLIPFERELMARYHALGADGAMRDEWGFMPDYNPDLRTYWWSQNLAADYKAKTGRDILADYPLMALGAKGDQSRTAAIRAYMKLMLDRNAEIERDFYDADKALFGEDAYVVKHPTWHSCVCPQEYWHNGLDWWQARRDWAQGDETTPIYVLNALAKKWGSPIWLNEGYTGTSERNVFRVWTYAMCGGRQVYHCLYSGDPNEMERYAKMPWEERRMRLSLDLLAAENVTAQSRVRLPNLISRAPADSPIAFVFGHERLMDWSCDGWDDHGARQMLSLLSQGWWCDAYPASECALGTFAVDADGYVHVGRQRYRAVMLHNLSEEERRMVDAIASRGRLKTRMFGGNEVEAVGEYLQKIGVMRQPLVKKRTKAGPSYPEPDGTLRLVDGTAIRIRADWEHPCGLPIDEEIESNGVKARIAAEGIAAVRSDGGEIVALAAGGLLRVNGPGLSIALKSPEDVVLLKLDGKWHGIWQTDDMVRPIPAEFAALTSHWIRLVLPNSRKPIKYVAHRGDYPDVPEGSMAAYRNAVERGSEIVKLDVHPSKDGVIVLSHDPSFKRTMDWDVGIADVTWDEIQRHTYNFEGRPTDERAVSLPDVLKVVQAIPEFWIDFKHFDTNFCERVLGEFARVGIDERRIMVATYTQEALRYMKAIHPAVRRIGHMDFALQDGKWSPSFLRPKGVLYAPAADGEPFAPEVAKGILSYADAMGLWGVNTCSDPRVITKELVAHLKEKGLMVSIALIHDAKAAKDFVGYGNDFVVTRDRRTVKPIIDCGTLPTEEDTAYIKDEVAVLPPYNDKAGGWYAGYLPKKIRTSEVAARHTLIPETVRVVAANGRELRGGKDFRVHPKCGDVGLVGEAAKDTSINPVKLSYGVRLERLDAWYRKSDGSLGFVRGTAVPSIPAVPVIPADAKLVATRWVRGWNRMDDGRIFVNEEPFTPPPVAVPADRAIPKTLAKLRSGNPVKVLAWGDSVTECSYLPASKSWPERVAALLRTRFPESSITLVRVGWGGRNTKSFLDEPPGSKYNFAEKVLAENPDLVISEFVNDSWMKTANVEDFYGKVLASFRERGIEWVAFSPHYITPDWMGLKGTTNCDDDPREYVRALRAFAIREGIGIADASSRWGHLWREGIPYPILFVNGVNHPDEVGLGFFVDAFQQFLDSARNAQTSSH